MPIQSCDDDGKLVFESTESNVDPMHKKFIEKLSSVVRIFEAYYKKRVVALEMKRGKISEGKPVFTAWNFEFEKHPKLLSEQKLVAIYDFPVLGVEIKISGLLENMEKLLSNKEWITDFIWALLPDEIELKKKEVQDEQSK